MTRPCAGMLRHGVGVLRLPACVFRPRSVCFTVAHLRRHGVARTLRGERFSGAASSRYGMTTPLKLSQRSIGVTPWNDCFAVTFPAEQWRHTLAWLLRWDPLSGAATPCCGMSASLRASQRSSDATVWRGCSVGGVLAEQWRHTVAWLLRCDISRGALASHCGVVASLESA